MNKIYYWLANFWGDIEGLDYEYRLIMFGEPYCREILHGIQGANIKIDITHKQQYTPAPLF